MMYNIIILYDRYKFGNEINNNYNDTMRTHTALCASPVYNLHVPIDCARRPNTCDVVLYYVQYNMYNIIQAAYVRQM